MNKYRVDRNNSKTVPCGMNSIRYLGDSWAQAQKVFNELLPGLDSWDKPNSSYGVVLSVWCNSKKDYVIKITKGFTTPNMHGTY